jgi:hypothetical protein
MSDVFGRPSAQLLPSADAALSFARGEPGSAWAVVASTGARALVVAPAVLAVGLAAKVPPQKAILMGIASALAIEAGVLALAFSEVKRERERAKGRPVLQIVQGGIQ